MDTPPNDNNPIVSATLEASTHTIASALLEVKQSFFALYRDLNYFDPSALARLESATKEEQALILDNDFGFMLVAFAVAKEFDIDWQGYAHLMQSLEQKMMIGLFGGISCDVRTFTILILISIRFAIKEVSKAIAQAHPVKAITAFFGG